MNEGIIIIQNNEYDININATTEFDSVLINALFCLPIYNADNRQNPSIYNLLSASLQQEPIGSKVMTLLQHNTLTTKVMQQIEEECVTVLQQIQETGAIDNFMVELERLNTNLVFKINLYIDNENIYKEYVYDATDKKMTIN